MLLKDVHFQNVNQAIMVSAAKIYQTSLSTEKYNIV